MKHRRKPTQEEERLMLLTGIKELASLNRYLNGPSLPPEATQSRPPDEAYDLQRQEDEEGQDLELVKSLYQMSPLPG